jgi:hypothetical protein
MVVKVRGCRPVKKNGKWDLVDYEREDYIPDDKVRHNLFCTYCGLSVYPECREWCEKDKRNMEKEKKEKQAALEV